MSTKLKVYLSKSKSGNFDELVKLKSRLELLDIEVLEFVGGTYDTKKLLEADILLILPPASKGVHYPTVGRGQFEEIDTFLEKYPNKQILVVTSLEDDDDIITVDEIDSYYEADNEQNWTTNWGILELNQIDNSILNYNIPLKPKTNQSCTKNLTNQAKRILICVKI